MKLTKGHKQVKCYADGGEVGKPTYAKAVAARLGIGDGYNYRPKKSTGPKKPDQKRLSISNAPMELGGVLAKRKKALDET